MLMKPKYQINVQLLVVMMLSLGSCKKFVEVAEPQDQLLGTDVFKTEASASSAVTSLYYQMMRTALYFSNAGMSVYTGLSSDEIINTSPNADNDAFRNNSLTAGMNVLINNVWVPAYKNIYQANAIIEGLEQSTLSDEVKKKLSGEAKFIRGFNYFCLVNLFGDVPLSVTTDYRYNSVASRTNVNEIYAQIISDLEYAYSNLDANYPVAGRTRANKWAAGSLLARVYLYAGKWVEAESVSSAVISSGVYSLVADPNNVFVSTSNEIILQFYPVINNANSSQGAQFIPSSATARPGFVVTTQLMNAFESGDTRKAKWTKTVVVSSQSYTHPNKYKVRNGATITENNVVLRLAELYLIRGEARARQNKLGEAKSDLDKIRSRAGLPTTTATSVETILAAIDNERRVELFTEGHRWLDLKRTQKADALLSIIKGSNWQTTDVLYPIPEEEMKRNPFLVQNSGY